MKNHIKINCYTKEDNIVDVAMNGKVVNKKAQTIKENKLHELKLEFSQGGHLPFNSDQRNNLKQSI